MSASGSALPVATPGSELKERNPDRCFPAVIFYNDEGACLLEAAASEGAAAEAAKSFTSLVHEVLLQLVGLPQFQRVILLQAKAEQLAVAVGYVELDEKDEPTDVFGVMHSMNILELLTCGLSGLPQLLQDKVAMSPVAAAAGAAGPGGAADEAAAGAVPQLQFSNEPLRRQAEFFNKAVKLGDRYNAALSEDAELELANAVEARRQRQEASGAAAAAPDAVPLQPSEVVELLAAYMSQVVGVQEVPANLLQKGAGVLQGALRFGQRMKRRLLVGGKVKRSFWRLEDLALRSGRLAAKLAIKSIRPILIGLIIRRALQTLEASQDLDLRTARQPKGQEVDYYYSHLLGADWEQQIEGDMVEALKEVDEGLITDEINHEKRTFQARLLRRMEIEEWDKERMKHFYYSQFGLGDWYGDMDEKLANPFFMGARAWNGGADNWVGDNTIFPNDLRHHTSDVERCIDTLERARGVRLSDFQKAVLRGSERVRPVDQVTAVGSLAGGLLDPERVREALGR